MLAAFVPQDKKETAALAALRKELGFDPTTGSEDLTASNETAKKSPKRILTKLMAYGDGEREAQCWNVASIEPLRTQGARNGLAEFIREVEKELSPLFVDS